MRVLLLLRGSAGCGKSTWIHENGLDLYTLSADNIRLLYQNPILGVGGNKTISPTNDGIVWKTLMAILERRMENGDFTVIDATNSRTSEMTKYLNLANIYRYRVYCVDFTSIPMEEVKLRNKRREEFKRVPDSAIEKMYSRFETQKIPSGIKVISPNELDKIWYQPQDLSDYKAIHHIGDIHGCNTVLQTYLNNTGGLKDDEYYIFCGDYVDRGIENADVLKFLMSIANKKNVLLLEGNHEIHLWKYANDMQSKSREFNLVTSISLDRAGISKKNLRMFYRKLNQCICYIYHGKRILVTHGGLSTLPENMTLVSTSQLIHGVGSYDDYIPVAASFSKSTNKNTYQIFGHRNTKDLPVKMDNSNYVLEGHVEFGGCLRCVKLNEDGFQTIETQNTVFKNPECKSETGVENSMVTIIENMRNNEYIKEKKFGNISSFNFTRNAFNGKVWTEQTMKARGLFLDTVKGKVVARAYTKFFNINEREETKLDALKLTMKFPVTAYVKENGFLGIVTYNEYTDDFFITSKSDPDGPFSGYLKSMFERKIPESIREKIKQMCKHQSVSFVFECVDMENDPHIIDYDESTLVLLDIVYNDISFRKFEYEKMKRIAEHFGIPCKKKAYEMKTWQEFYDWYHVVTSEDYLYEGKHIEGFVIEDANGYMTKLKVAYYNFWKSMRYVSREAIKKGYITKTSTLTTPLANKYYAWVKELFNHEDKDKLVGLDICTLRHMFYHVSL